jgi:ParB/RepB/Spo0J family partition protein
MFSDQYLWLLVVVVPLCLICTAVVLPPVVEIPTRKCFPDPNNQRKIYELDTLKQSISQVGILQPIGVRLDTARGCYFAMWGNSRLLCAIDLGLEVVPARVWERELARLEVATFQTAENVARNDLRPSERAASIRELMTLEGLTVAAFAEKWSMSAATVWRNLTLLDQPQDIIALVDQGLMPMSTVAALARLPDEESKRAMIDQIREGGLPRHKVEEAVQAVVGKRNGKPKNGRLSFRLGNVSIAVTGDALTVASTTEAAQLLVKHLRKAAELGQNLETLALALRKGA